MSFIIQKSAWRLHFHCVHRQIPEIHTNTWFGFGIIKSLLGAGKGEKKNTNQSWKPINRTRIRSAPDPSPLWGLRNGIVKVHGNHARGGPAHLEKTLTKMGTSPPWEPHQEPFHPSETTSDSNVWWNITSSAPLRHWICPSSPGRRSSCTSSLNCPGATPPGLGPGHGIFPICGSSGTFPQPRGLALGASLASKGWFILLILAMSLGGRHWVWLKMVKVEHGKWWETMGFWWFSWELQTTDMDVFNIPRIHKIKSKRNTSKQKTRICQDMSRHFLGSMLSTSQLDPRPVCTSSSNVPPADLAAGHGHHFPVKDNRWRPSPIPWTHLEKPGPAMASEAELQRCHGESWPVMPCKGWKLEQWMGYKEKSNKNGWFGGTPIYGIIPCLGRVCPKVSNMQFPSWIRNRPGALLVCGALPQFSQVFSRWGQVAISCTSAWKNGEIHRSPWAKKDKWIRCASFLAGSLDCSQTCPDQKKN